MTAKKHIKSSTYDGYEYFVTDILGKNNDASSDLGSAQILNVTNKQIQQYVDGWADFLPKSSIKKNKALLRQIFKYAKREGIISIDPTPDMPDLFDEFNLKSCCRLLTGGNP